MAREPIAIVGAAARLPGAPSLDAYWDLLAAGRDAVSEIPEGRWSKRYYFHPDPRQPGKSYTWAAGVLDDVESFDPAVFGMSPREAEQVDPQQRLLLELALEALEDAGIPSRDLAGSRAGVYVGFSSAEYANIRMGDPSGADAYFMTGTTASIAANRISYVFDLHGPSFVVDTACSSSLVALAQACQALQDGEIPMALVGAVNMLLSPYPYVGFSRAAMLSPTGRCHAFDARADGYVRAEGGGLIVLKPLSEARSAGDEIRGLILGCGVNSDGRTAGLSLPNGAAQAQLLRDVYAEAEVTADELAFIEAHGTGTAAGDPIEIGAIGEALATARAGPLLVGSAKTNVGHLETASGMAGLLKAMLSLEHRRLPASLHFETPNPGIAFEDLNVRVAAEPALLAAEGRLVAGVNSFGFGGTNAHAILASAPPVAAPASTPGLPPLLISAHSKPALETLAQSWAAVLREQPSDAADRLRGAARRRDHHRHRIWARAETPQALAAALTATDPPANVLTGEAVPGALALVFSGNGAQWAGMGADALGLSPAFRAGVVQADAALAPHLGWSVLQRLEGDPAAQDLTRTDVAQPLLFAVQVGAVGALRAAGVEGAAFVGHSVGEIAAAWASGALSLDAAARVVAARSRAQQQTQGLGRMAAVGTDAETGQAALNALGSAATIAAVNSPSSVTIAGPLAELDRLEAEAARRGWAYRLLDIGYPFHTAAMDPIRAGLQADLDGLAAGASERFVSTVLGGPTGERRLDADYWWRNIREPVAFLPAIEHLLGAGVRQFLEVGPAAILRGYLRETVAAAEVEAVVLGTLSRKSPKTSALTIDPFPAIAGALYTRGYDLQHRAPFDGPTTVRGLPGHPWQRTRYWSDPTDERVPIAAPASEHPLLGFRWERDGRSWKALLDADLHPWLADHAIEGVPVLPAAAILELAFAAGRSLPGAAKGLEVRDLQIARALVLEPGRTREARLRLDEDGGFVLESRVRLSEEPWLAHASGRILLGAGSPQPASAVSAGRGIDPSELYVRAAALGLDYGPAFQTIIGLEAGDAEANVRLGPSGLVEGFLLAPNLADGAFQALLALAPAGADATLLPWRIGSAKLFEPYGRDPVFAQVRLTHVGGRSVEGEVRFHDAEGRPVAELAHCWFRRVRLNRKPNLDERLLRMTPRPSPLDATTPSPAAALLAHTAWSAPPEAAEDEALMLRAYLAAALDATVRDLSAVPFDVATLVVEGRLAPEVEPLLRTVLEELAALGLATSGPDGWRLEDPSELGDAGAVWRRLLEDAPRLGPTLTVAAAAVARTGRLFAEGLAAAPVLPAGLVRQTVDRSAAGEYAAQALAARLADLAAAWPANRPLRVLEVGAGEGGLTRRALRLLRASRRSLEYVASDPDADAVAALAFDLGGAPDAEAALWPLGDERSFDVLLSRHGLTRLTQDSQAVREIAACLAPDAVMLACEPAPNLLWDLLGGSPAQDAEGWSQTLAAAGLEARTATVAAAPWDLQLIEAVKPARAAPVRAALDTRGWAVSGPAGDALAAALEAQGLRRAESLQGEAAERLWAEGVDDLVVMASGCDAAGQMAEVLDAARAVREAGARLWVVTRGAWADSPAGGAVWGLGRTLINEAPELACQLFDAAPDVPAEDAARALLDEAAHRSPEREVLLTAEGRQVLRLERGRSAQSASAPFVRLDAGEPGRLDSLRWIGAPEAPTPGDGEVLVEVTAAALNFRDVMWAMDLLPEEALMDGFAGATLGLECAGVVRALGPGAEGFAVGDRVMAFAPGALASHVLARPQTLVKLPDALGEREAATLPVAYLTVIYALETVARLTAGEWVLIHAGAGGVGLAAIRYAQHVGARIIATAGSEAKRGMLRLMGVEHVLDSRSLAFADEVRAICGGVDVVLNSLNGAAMERSLEVVAPFGRFVELGKRDFFEDTRVGLRPLRRNVSYFAVDVDVLPKERPELARALLERAVDLVGQGVLHPLPYVSFGFSEATAAFRLMQAAGHVGKIVLVPDAPEAAPGAPAAPDFRADATYLVSGGLSGFGLATAQWLAANGARHLVLLGRRGLQTPGAEAAVAELAAQGVEVRAVACDVADRDAVQQVVEQIARDLPPLRGVIHAAMQLEDGLLLDLDRPRLEMALTAKLGGAENLDVLTRAAPLDFFVLYSSAVTLMGAPGQGAYVAANQALETVARRRRAQGRAALAVGWGPIADVGVLARQEATREALARRLAATPIPAAEALEALGALLSAGETAPAYAAVQWDLARRRLAILSSPTFRGFAAGGGAGEEAVDLTERLAGLGPAEARDLVTAILTDEVARILACAPGGLDPRRPLLDLGMDSLMGVELRLALESRLGVSLPLFAMSDSTNLASLAQRVIEMLAPGASEASALADAVMRHETATPPSPAAIGRALAAE